MGLFVCRRFCQKCRLKKCFTIGMKKEFIMSEEERSVKRRKIEENRMKKTSQRKPTKNAGRTAGSMNKMSEIKSEAESSFSDSDVSASPLGNSLDGSPNMRISTIHSAVDSPSNLQNGIDQNEMKIKKTHTKITPFEINALISGYFPMISPHSNWR